MIMTNALFQNFQKSLPFGSADFTESTALIDTCGRKLQLRADCLVSPANSALATFRYEVKNRSSVSPHLDMLSLSRGWLTADRLNISPNKDGWYSEKNFLVRQIPH
jgi:hypothetical protein